MMTKIGYVPKDFYAPETVHVENLIGNDIATKLGIELTEVVLPGGWYKPFAFVSYSQNKEVQPPARFDLDKVAFMDHFDDKMKEQAFRSLAPHLANVLRDIHSQQQLRSEKGNTIRFGIGRLQEEDPTEDNRLPQVEAASISLEEEDLPKFRTRRRT